MAGLNPKSTRTANSLSTQMMWQSRIAVSEVENNIKVFKFFKGKWLGDDTK
jgi:hypothetical protein